MENEITTIGLITEEDHSWTTGGAEGISAQNMIDAGAFGAVYRVSAFIWTPK